jgi:hypothetical protein
MINAGFEKKKSFYDDSNYQFLLYYLITCGRTGRDKKIGLCDTYEEGL